MSYCEFLREIAKLGLDKFKYELKTNPRLRGLLWTIKDVDGITEVTIETFKEDGGYGTEYLTSLKFNNSGEYIA